MSSDPIDIRTARAAIEERAGHAHPAAPERPPTTLVAGLNSAARIVAQGAPLPDLLHSIAELAAQALDADLAVIRSVLPDRANFVVSAAAGPPRQHLTGLLGAYTVITDVIRTCPPGDSLLTDLAG